MAAAVSVVFVGVSEPALAARVGRWVHGELALRRELPAGEVPVPGTAAAVPRSGQDASAPSEPREIV